MPHSSDFGWTERQHEDNRCENGGRRGGDLWARGQLPRAAGPPPGPCSARGGAQDACSDPGGRSRARPPWNAPSRRLPRAELGPRSARPVRCGPARPRPSSHGARLRRSGRKRTSGCSRNSPHSAPTTSVPARSSPSSGFGTSPACEDVRVPRIRRPGPIGLALTAFEVWRRLPPEQRRQLMDATRKQAPRAAAAALAYWRSRPPRRR
jgi:hypothetical protein